MTRPLTFEVCVETIDGVVAARAGGAQRVELCTSLAEGGLTPSIGAVLAAKRAGGIAVMTMIRPRGGDFCYSTAELETMELDVERAAAAGSDGFVFGVLCSDGTIDRDRTARLIERAGGRPVTVHRAFDMTRDPFAALETLCELGVARILTSGQASSAPAGAELIRELVERAGDRIAIMPGGGVRRDNVHVLLATTGAREVHFSASGSRPSAMAFRNERCKMGGPGRDEYSLRVTDEDEVAAIVRAASQL